MQHLALAAITKITLHRREKTAIIRPYHGGLILHAIHYQTDIQAVPDYGKTNTPNLKKFGEATSQAFRPSSVPTA